MKHRKVIRLSGEAAVIRHMLPLGKALAGELSDPNVAEEAAIGSLKGDSLNGQSIKFSLQRTALRGRRPKVFHIRPKLHRLLEMGRDSLQGQQPETRWTYRDEDFGGAAAHFAKRRGSALAPEGFSVAW
eukprot:2283405-Pyramimonas_sp.AAC.1